MKCAIFILLSFLLQCTFGSDEAHTYTIDLSDFPEDTLDDYDAGVNYDRELIPEDRAVCSGGCQVRCNGEKTVSLADGESKMLCSNKYPSKYSKGQDCKITVEVPSTRWIKVTFCVFKVRYHSKCQKDFLMVLDRALYKAGVKSPCEDKVQRVRRFCGSQTGNKYYIKTPYTRFRFKTNNDKLVEKGFRILVEPTENPCYFQLQAPSGLITSQKKDDKYHANYYCRWDYAYNSSSANEALEVTCPSFDIHPGYSYKDISPDCFHISTSDDEESYTGTQGPNHATTGADATLEFFANLQFERPGFTCNYTIVPAGGLGEPCAADNCNSERTTCSDNVCVCNTADGYSAYNGALSSNVDVCQIATGIGSSCDGSYDCAAEDSDSYCKSGKCACKSGYVDIGSSIATSKGVDRCQIEKSIGSSCYTSSQCVKTSYTYCKSSKCACKSGYSTSSCDGGKYSKKCSKSLTVSKGTKGKKFTMPSTVSGNFKFCITGFTVGKFYFLSGTLGKTSYRKLQYTWSSSTKVSTYKKVGTNAAATSPKKTYSIKASTDFFSYTKSGSKSKLKNGKSSAVVSNTLIFAPTKWSKFYLYTPKSSTTRTIVFVVP